MRYEHIIWGWAGEFKTDFKFLNLAKVLAKNKDINECSGNFGS